MKTILTALLLIISGLPASRAEEPVRSYHDLLAVIPKEMNPDFARNWSQSEKDVANKIIKEKIVDAKRRASLRIRAEPVEAWPGLTLWCPLPSEEGYPIRFFLGLFKDEKQIGKIAALRAGDFVQVEGIVDAVKFEDQWGGPALWFGVREGVITKLQPDGKPAPPQPKINVSVVSAVYGSGDKFADVTDRVKTILDEPGAQFYVKPHWLGADPTQGWNKTLVIVYQFEGKRRIFTTGEGGAVSAELLAKKDS